MSIHSQHSFLRTGAAALIASLFFTACGGGGAGGATDPSVSNADDGKEPVETPVSPSDDPAPQPPAPQQPAPQPASLVIDYYGDSTVWGYGTHTGARVATPAPAAFAAALPNPSRYTVHNEGVNSSTACQLLNGQDGRHPAWDVQMASSDAHVVILNHAINDQWKNDVSTYKSCLTALAVKAKSHGKKVVFETPNPTLNSGAGGMDVYVDAMKAVAAEQNVPVIDQHAYLTNYLDGRNAYTICPDGLHPTDAVYVMKGKYAASEFAKLGY